MAANDNDRCQSISTPSCPTEKAPEEVIEGTLTCEGGSLNDPTYVTDEDGEGAGPNIDRDCVANGFDSCPTEPVGTESDHIDGDDDSCGE